MIRLDGVSKRFADGVGVLDDVDMHVPAGALAVVTGPSARGPGTVVRLINRILDVDSGTITIDGVSIEGRDPDVLRRSLGYMTGEIGLFPHLSVIDNVLAVPRLCGQDDRQAKARALELLDHVGLSSGSAAVFPRQLSGTEPHRVALARALAARPSILLLDEPFAGSEPAQRAELRRLLRDLHVELELTIVLAGHDVDDALGLGDLVVLLSSNGRVAQHGRPDEILADPVNDEVRRFLGSGRGIRQLGLARLAAAPDFLGPVVPVSATGAEARVAAATGDSSWVLLVDDENRPVGWADCDQIGDLANVTDVPLLGVVDTLSDTTSLLDVLDHLVRSPTRMAVRLADDGTLRGIVSAASIIAALPRTWGN